MNPGKYIGLIAASIMLVACDGNKESGRTIITGKQSTSESGSSQDPQPSLRTLAWPADFPAEIRAGLTDAVIVSGLSANTAYDFDVTLPTSASADNSTLFVLNVDSENQSGGPVCYGDPGCTGTVITNLISMQLVSTDAGSATVNIVPSSSPALINEGSADSPVTLEATSDNMTLQGTVGGTQAVQNELIAGESFYRVDNLTIGDRYSIMLNDSTDDVVLSIDEAHCDPVYSAGNHCVFPATDSKTDFSVTGDSNLFGASFSATITHLSAAEDFEGNWHTPVPLTLPEDPETTYHFGRSDQYSSYYSLQELDQSQRYLLTLSGTTTAARLKVNAPLTGEPDDAPQCRAVDTDDETGDQYCIIKNAIDARFRIESVNDDSNYVVSIEPGMKNEGTSSSALTLQYANPGLFYRGETSTTSHYKLEALSAGSQYLLQVYSSASFAPGYELTSSDNQPIVCDDAGQSHCIFTAIDTEINVAVSDNNSDIGTQYNLSLLPIDASDTVTLAPFSENLLLSLSDMPHTGTVGDLYSEYTVTDLVANHYYLATIRDRSETMSFAAWPHTESSINCNISTLSNTTGCLIRAGADGQIRIRIGGDKGGQYALSVIDAFNLQSSYQSTDPILTIPDYTAAAVTSTIEVPDSHTVGFIEVELQIDHGYSEDLLIQLEAPNGEIITLADHVPGSAFSGTIYSDLAAAPNPAGFSTHVLQSYRPDQPLHSLYGTDSAGVWTLHVSDDTNSNRSDALGGQLLTWGLTIIDTAPLQVTE